MPDPAWPSSPPEANYVRLVGTGAAGTATTLASAAAWEALMAGNEAAISISTVNTAVTALNFEGLGGAASATSVGGLNAALQLLAGWVQEKPPIAASAVAAYETAVSTMIPAEVSLANRAEQAADVAINPLVLGALTPVIVALDMVYFGEHWPHNASAGAAYGSALTALLPALAVPPPLAPPGASPAAPAAAAAAVAETAGQTAAGQAMQQSGQMAEIAAGGAAAPSQAAGQVGQLATSLTQPLQSSLQPLTGMLEAPTRALQSLSGLDLGDALDDAFTDDAAPSMAMLPTGGVSAGFGAAGAGPLGPTPSGAGIGGSPGVGGVPGAGLTSYTRPNSAFAPENSGRPVSLKTGLLGAAEFRGPTAPTGGAVPVSPAQSGMLRPDKDRSNATDVVRARVVTTDDSQAEKPTS